MDKFNNKNSFNVDNIIPVELKLLNGQVELILRSLELYSYNLEYMLNESDTSNEERQEKIAKLKYTFEQILSAQAEQVNGKSESTENLSNLRRNMIKDDNIIRIIPEDKELGIG